MLDSLSWSLSGDSLLPEKEKLIIVINRWVNTFFKIRLGQHKNIIC